MSHYAVASKITLANIIERAKVDVAERVEQKKTPTASYFIEDGGLRYVVTITPATAITSIVEGRRSVH